MTTSRQFEQWNSIFSPPALISVELIFTLGDPVGAGKAIGVGAGVPFHRSPAAGDFKGIDINSPQCGHLPFLPAFAAGMVSVWPQLRQSNRIASGFLCVVFAASAVRGTAASEEFAATELLGI